MLKKSTGLKPVQFHTDWLDVPVMMDAAAVATQLPPSAPTPIAPAKVIEPVFRDRGPRPVQPAQPSSQAATGTDGPSALDTLMTRLSERLNDRQI